MRRVCGLESLRIVLGFRNQRLRSQIQTSPMELPGPDLEDLKISWKTPKQVRPYERPSTKQWHGAERCLLEALIAPQTWTPVSMLTNWTQTPLTLFFAVAPSYFHRPGPYLQCIPPNCDISFPVCLLAFRTPAISSWMTASFRDPFLPCSGRGVR